MIRLPNLPMDRSAETRRRRQKGESCFTLSRVDEPLPREPAGLTDRGFVRYRDLKLTGKKVSS